MKGIKIVIETVDEFNNVSESTVSLKNEDGIVGDSDLAIVVDHFRQAVLGLGFAEKSIERFLDLE
jgi:hypothetical protein